VWAFTLEYKPVISNDAFTATNPQQPLEKSWLQHSFSRYQITAAGTKITCTAKGSLLL
jgi:hypothetical protein